MSWSHPGLLHTSCSCVMDISMDGTNTVRVKGLIPTGATQTQNVCTRGKALLIEVSIKWHVLKCPVYACCPASIGLHEMHI